MYLVSVIGDFHSSIMPITYEFKNSIKKHFLVYDDSKYERDEYDRVIKAQKRFLEQNPHLNYKIVEVKLDEDSYESIQKAYESIVKSVDSVKDLYLNTTDGLSSISIVLSQKFLSLGARVISYDRFANTYNLHDKSSMKKYKIKNSMDIKSHFILKGYEVLNRTLESELEKRKEMVLEFARDLGEFKRFTTSLQNHKLDDIKGYDRYKSLLKKHSITNQTYLQGGVFEEYIYHLLKDNFDFDDIWTGVKIEVDDGVENEFDILMIKDNHLHAIECKFVNSLHGEHYVYKLDLLSDYLDDDAKAMILSIGAKNERVTKTGRLKVQFTKGDRARAKYGKIKIHQREKFDKELFLKDVKEWFLG